MWQRVLGEVQRAADTEGQLDWRTHYVDGTVVRAHQQAAGTVGGQHHEALGWSRGGCSTKIHLRAEGGGKPMAVVLSGGERHESLYLDALLTAGSVRRAGRGRPRRHPVQLVGDRGYSYQTVRQTLARAAFGPSSHAGGISGRRTAGPAHSTLPCTGTAIVSSGW